MILLFWICTILLALSALGALVRPAPWYGPAGVLLIAIDLVILGAKALGWPH